MVQIHKRFFSCLAHVGALALAGCYSSRDLSHVSPFNAYVGKTVRLERSVGIQDSGAFPTHSRVDFKLGDLPNSDLSSASKLSKNGQHINKTDPFAVGRMVQIDRVADEITSDNESIVAYGHVPLSSAGKAEATFAYEWGDVWTLTRAPWEPDAVPPKRYPPFRVPPHWDYPKFFDLGKKGQPMWGTSDPNATLSADRN